MKSPIVLSLILFLGFCSCKSLYTSEYKKPLLVDKKVSRNIKKLHKKLSFLSTNGFAVGHQDATAYGIGWKYADQPEQIKSDINEVVGDFPAVYGFDIARIEHAHNENIDGVPFDVMKKLIIDAHKKGGIITISWHADNPVSGGDSWDKTPAVADIINGGASAEKFELWISEVAVFLKSLRYKGKAIPIVFRPWHEMNGAWFWWGDPNCTASDYIKLWQHTVTLLRDKHKFHNLIYTYSPNRLAPGDDYMKYYPGDDYVDILGLDTYDFNDSEEYAELVVRDLKLVKEIATTKNKLYAFTETGLEKIPTPNWFTQFLYPAIENSGISWILFWRNDRESHHYLPYKGHSIEEDFRSFEALPRTFFLKDINRIKY